MHILILYYVIETGNPTRRVAQIFTIVLHSLCILQRCCVWLQTDWTA